MNRAAKGAIEKLETTLKDMKDGVKGAKRAIVSATEYIKTLEVEIKEYEVVIFLLKDRFKKEGNQCQT